MKVLRLTPDAVKAVLDSMESNDHCTRDYHVQITEIREQIAEFAGDGGLILQRPVKASDGSGVVVNIEPSGGQERATTAGWPRIQRDRSDEQEQG